MIILNRAYDKINTNGYRILVERFWPRWVTKENLKVDLWLKEIAPSNKLRQWFMHDPVKWDEFRKKYFIELNNNKENIGKIINLEKDKSIILIYSSSSKYNNAEALKEYIVNKNYVRR